MSEFHDRDPDDPDERQGDDPDWSPRSEADDLGSSRGGPDITEFTESHRPFPRDEPDEIDRGEGNVDDGALSMEALTSFLTGPEAADIRAEVQREQDRGIAVRDYRKQTRKEAVDLLESTSIPPAYVGRLVDTTLGLVELSGLLVEPIVIPDSIDDTGQAAESDPTPEDGELGQAVRDIVDAAATVEQVRTVADIPDHKLARVYFMEWSKLGSQEARGKLESLLVQERQDAERFAPYRCLTSVCEVAESIGLSPDGWIERYADKDSAWRLRLEHYERQRKQLKQEQDLGVDAERKGEQLQAVDAKIDGLMQQFGLPSDNPDALSTRAVSVYYEWAVLSSRTAETDAVTARRFLEVSDELGATPDNLSSLISFGVNALKRRDGMGEGVVDAINDRVHRVAAELEATLQDPFMCEILNRKPESIARQQGYWQVYYNVARGMPVDKVSVDISQEVASAGGDKLKEDLLLAATYQYAEAGDYASAHAMVSKVEPSFRRDKAYTELWGKVKSAEQMAALDPTGKANDSAGVLPVRYEIAKALVSGDTAVMGSKALEAVAILQDLSATENAGPTFDEFFQGKQIEQLMHRVGQIGGGAELRRLCRAMLAQLQGSPRVSHLNYEKIYEPLEKSGSRADREAVRASILACPSEDIVKAAKLVESALRAGTTLVDED